MCGIIGIGLKSGRVDTQKLCQMRDAMIHRGPDDAGVWISEDGTVGLAHRRLAIIDLSKTGHQPMADGSGRFRIIFNGEIYNYQDLRKKLEMLGQRFVSTSDTEVILTAYIVWGVDCLKQLNGMFAFAIHDKVAGTIFLARDRAGEKPLFYYHGQNIFIFASELKAMMAEQSLPRNIDYDALEFYFTFGYIPGEKCILKGFSKLSPAHALLYNVKKDDINIWRYWQVPLPTNNYTTSIADLSDELEALLRDSVRRHLIADVPVGILLSGGIDSSLVTALAAQKSSSRIKTFTITFPDHDDYDESYYAKTVSRFFGTQHIELVAEQASFDLLPGLARQFDEPMCDSSMIPSYMVTKMTRQYVKVALSGDGGDELFGGYPHYNWILNQEKYKNIIPSWVRTILSSASERFLPVGLRGRNYLLGLSGRTDNAIAHANLFFDPSSLRRLLLPVKTRRMSSSESPFAFKTLLCANHYNLPGQAMIVDFLSYLPDDILVKVDRASMVNSLEMRAPFLDYRIIEFAFRYVPNKYRTNGRDLKILLRDLASKLLPPELDIGRKHGFSVPGNKWFSGIFGSFMKKVLHDADVKLFNQDEIRKLISLQNKGYLNFERLYAITLFELWRHEYKVIV